jgi:maltooligosyltrehalose trehalohydrolase
MTSVRRRMAIGAEVQQTGVHFRVWAPKRKAVDVLLDGRDAIALQAEGDGYFSALVAGAGQGARYRYRLDGGEAFPDPASRFQPDGPHGPSEVVDPGAHSWTDDDWRGVRLQGQVLYEMHIGTFTPAGTWSSAAKQLKALADLGVTVLEIMPVAEFPGRFNWGYDGVDLFAPAHVYGRPDDMRAFVDAAHALGLGVILDVVYNHLGPDGNYLAQYSDTYFTDRYETEWGEPLNFDGPGSAPVREYFIANAGYWIDEYHLDGLRLDATQNVYDSGSDHVLAAIVREVRRRGGLRATIVVGENEPNDTRLLRSPAQGGFGLDALWNDDLHHSAYVTLTGHNEAYYTDYRGTAQELLSATKYGYLYQGQRYRWQQKRRGTPTFGLPKEAFVSFLENHDQVANSGRGDRMHRLSSPGRHRAMTGLLLLGPGTPMLFQGQEFASSRPFLFFADHKKELNEKVRAGRRAFLGQFRSLGLDEWTPCFADPADPATFQSCVLDHAEREAHKEAFALHRDLLRVRREDPVFRDQGRAGFDGAVLSADAFVLRYFAPGEMDRLLIVNLGPDLNLDPAPEPLLAPPVGRRWRALWSSEDRAYGGCGTPPPDTDENWHIPGHAAIALWPVPEREEPTARVLQTGERK